MKKSEKSLSLMRLSVACFSLFLSFSLWASSSIKVDRVEGSCFALWGGKTVAVTQGAEFPLGTELMVSEDSFMSFKDYDDHLYHLSAGTGVKFLGEEIDLKTGTIFVRSFNSVSTFKVNTANSSALYQKDHFVLSFDSIAKKSQLLVLEGEVGFLNPLVPEASVAVSDGHFSFVDDSYDNSLPRTPTFAGAETFKEATAVFASHGVFDFKGAKDELKATEVKREIASVLGPSAETKVTTPGKIIFLSRTKTDKGRSIASVPTSHQGQKDLGIIRVFGKGSHDKNLVRPAKELKREISSVQPSLKESELASLIKELSQSRGPASDSFTRSLEGEYEKQKRHPQELNQLIDDLKSYKRDYQKEY